MLYKLSESNTSRPKVDQSEGFELHLNEIQSDSICKIYLDELNISLTTSYEDIVFKELEQTLKQREDF